MKAGTAIFILATSLAMPEGNATADHAHDVSDSRFFGTLPDAACASLDVQLTLQADGRYSLLSHCQDDLAARTEHGRWSVTWNGTCIALAAAAGASPGSREFAIHDDDLLVLATGSCIEPIEDPRGRSLRRASGALPGQP